MQFTIPVKPVGQMRTRACIRGKHASVYKHKTQEKNEHELAAHLLVFRPKRPLEGPLALHLDA